MMKFVKRFALVLCLLSLCLGLMGVSAFAAYDPITANVPVKISLSGFLPETPDTFKIEVSPAEDTFPMPEGTVGGVFTMEMTAESAEASEIAASFDITYDKHGIYTYSVTQSALGNENCYQDERSYTLVAQVINNSDYSGFELIIIAYVDTPAEKGEILFENRYAMPTEIQLSATKTMDGKTPKDGAFSFELVDASGAVVETVANDAEGKITFLPISYYQSGTYTYTIREVKGTNKNIIYDASAYAAVVEVEKDDNGDYIASLAYTKDNKAVDGAAFANKTKPIVPQTGDTANPMLWGGIMVVALAAIVVLLLAMKKKSKKA